MAIAGRPDVRVEIRSSYRRAFLHALDHLLDNEAIAAAERFAEAALVSLPDRLERHPRSGRDYLARNPGTPRLLETLARVRSLLGTDIELREILLEDYLVLYAIQNQTVHLLAIRHHRQSSFEIDG